MKLFALREEFGKTVKKGDTLFAPGQAADEFYVVMRGHVQVDRPGMEPEVVPPGDLVGEVEVFTEQPRSGAATALDDCNLLAFNRDTAIKLAEATPSFALVVIRKSCQRVARAESLLANGAAPAAPARPAATTSPSLAAALPGAAAAAPPVAPVAAVAAAGSEEVGRPPAQDQVGPVTSVDYASALWKKDVKCPNCRTTFHPWNVRSQAIVTDGNADTDLMNHYSGPDPNWYAVWVCPNCQLAAYADDFQAMQSVQVARVKPHLEELKKAEPRKFDFTYYRDEDLARRSYELATAFYEGQRGGTEKVAGLYHRMAWIERGRGNGDEEKKWLKKARDSYEKAFTSSDAAKAGVLWAYLIGELDARIGDFPDAVKWFQVAAQQPDFKSQPLLEKMVRDRQQEVAANLRSAKTS
ncbi:MAG TPA: DUF2225 domain-containing protein [Chloroflexota bacterium]|jgi:hypothetical protein|nr:DUF2225 domain-containing protein [Chloroflexota bacterium]